MFSRFTLLRVSRTASLTSAGSRCCDAHLLDEAGYCGPTFPQVLWPILYRELVVLENALHMVMTAQQGVGSM